MEKKIVAVPEQTGTESLPFKTPKHPTRLKSRTEQDRQERLAREARALRANLARRKQQQRGMRALTPSPESDTP